MQLKVEPPPVDLVLRRAVKMELDASHCQTLLHALQLVLVDRIKIQPLASVLLCRLINIVEQVQALCRQKILSMIQLYLISRARPIIVPVRLRLLVIYAVPMLVLFIVEIECAEIAVKFVAGISAE